MDKKVAKFMYLKELTKDFYKIICTKKTKNLNHCNTHVYSY